MKDEFGYLQKAVRKAFLCFYWESYSEYWKISFDRILYPVRDTATDISKKGLFRSIVYVINHDNFELHRTHSDRVFKNLEKLTTGDKYITNECEFFTPNDLHLQNIVLRRKKY